MVVVDEQQVEQEQLADRVHNVGYLDAQVGGDEKVAVQSSADYAADFCDEMLDADAAPRSVIPLRQQVAVHLVDDVAESLLANLQVRRLRADVRRVHNRAEVDPRSLV